MNTPQRASQSPWSPLAEPAALRNDKGRAELGEIVVFIDGQTETAGILELAGALAQEHGAHLTGEFMQPLPGSTPPEMFARGKGIPHVIEAHQAQLEGIEAGHQVLGEGRLGDLARRTRIA